MSSSSSGGGLAFRTMVSCAMAMGSAVAATGQNIYVFGTDSAAIDAGYRSALTAQGFTVTTGVRGNLFDGSVSLVGYQAVLMTCPIFSPFAAPTLAGQQQLVDFVNAGGGLITTEAVLFMQSSFNNFATLVPILPAAYDGSYNYSGTTLTRVTSDPIMDAGLPASFVIARGEFDTESRLRPKAGATEFYHSPAMGGAAAAGWGVGAGRVLSLSHWLDGGGIAFADANYAQLLGNSARWVVPSPGAGAVLGLAGLLALRRRR